MKRVYTQIRLPEDLHREVKELAEQEDRSLNNMMVRLLTEGVNARRRQANTMADQIRDWTPEEHAEYIRISQPRTGTVRPVREDDRSE
jgi:predicted transcriptional regulator